MNISKLKIILKIVTIIILLLIYVNYKKHKNPFENVYWEVDFPGSTSRYIQFTPVLDTNHKIKLGPDIGIDNGELYFEDINNDGIKEAIIETDTSFFNLEASVSDIKERFILEYKKGNNPKFILLKYETFSSI